MEDDTHIRKSNSVISMLGEVQPQEQQIIIVTLFLEKKMPIVPTVAKNGHYKLNCTYMFVGSGHI